MHHFFAYVSRMKLIERWSLMHSLRKENVQEHSLEVTIVAHALGLIGNKKFGKKYDVERIALLATFHDASEVMTGDLPTPVKYFNSDIKKVYKKIEEQATEKLLSFLPKEFQEDYRDLLCEQKKDVENLKIVKAADVLCAYIKCIEEVSAGNREFNQARESIEKKLIEMNIPEVDFFIEHFLKSYSLSLDELNKEINPKSVQINV